MGSLIQHAFGAEYERMLAIAAPSSQRWANSQGWNFLPTVSQIYPKPFGYSSVGFICFIKYLSNLKDGEYAASMDADLININPDVKIERLLNEHDIAVHGNENFSSCGFIAVRNTSEVRGFFHRMLLNGKVRDTQDDISARLHEDLMSADNRINGVKFVHVDDRWNWYDKYFGCDKPVTHSRKEAINIAFHGMNMMKRVAGMEALAKEIA